MRNYYQLRANTPSRTYFIQRTQQIRAHTNSVSYVIWLDCRQLTFSNPSGRGRVSCFRLGRNIFLRSSLHVRSFKKFISKVRNICLHSAVQFDLINGISHCTICSFRCSVYGLRLCVHVLLCIWLCCSLFFGCFCCFKF